MQHQRPRDTVIDVCERADIGRSTFYVHFADKEELMLSGFEKLETALMIVEIRAGGLAGLGYSYIDLAAATVVRDLLAPAIRGGDVLAIPDAITAMLRAPPGPRPRGDLHLRDQ